MYPIRHNSYPPKKNFAVNELEEDFFEYLSSKLTKAENSKIKLIRMSNGALCVEYSGYPIGRIKLQGRKNSMQVIKSSYKFYDFEGNVEDFKSKVNDWVEYLRKL